jgi:hypothetical protein
MMSDCSAETESEGDETDAEASVTCTAEGSGRRGEASAETGDMGACTPIESIPGRGLGSRRELMARTATIAPDLDSRCAMDVVSPELARVTDLKVYELAEQVPSQLGTRGSQMKIEYSTKTCIVNADTFIEQSPRASEEVPSVREDTNDSRFVNSTCRDGESDCSVESTTEKETDADASILSVARDNMEGHLKVPKDDEKRHLENQRAAMVVDRG